MFSGACPACSGVNTASINVHLDHEPLGMRPLLGESPNPNLSSAQQQVTCRIMVTRHPLADAVDLRCHGLPRALLWPVCNLARLPLKSHGPLAPHISSVSSAQASGPCNLEMPNGPSVYQRYLWYLRLLTYNGFVVLADNHLNSDGTIVNAGVDTWVSVRALAPSHSFV